MAPTIKALIRHLVIGGLWHPVKRRAEQELISELSRGRFSSFPFLSPDTFRAMSDVVVEGDRILRRRARSRRSIVFFDLGASQVTEGSFSTGGLMTVLESAQDLPVLIMANAPVLPDAEVIRGLEAKSRVVFATNVVHETKTLRAIPLGLENLSRNRNGRLKDYFEEEWNNPRPRSRDVFSAFEVDNNPAVRGPLADALLRSRFGWNPKRTPPEEYRRAVTDSLFVLSPPGKGGDCHRTWEAIYLGAVPVVLEGTVSSQMVASLPILEVASYSDFLQLTHEEMVNLHSQVARKETHMAYAPYWVSEVMAEGNG